MQIDITQIALALIALMSAVVTGFIIPWLKSKLTKNQQDILKSIIKTGVYAAEQLFPQPHSGSEKLKYVQKYLANLGYDIDTEAIRTSIESEVKELAIIISEK